MTHEKFDEFVNNVFIKIGGTLCSKSADYSTSADKLYNFKLQARIDGISPIEALRGNWLKHRSSISQGLDELQRGKVRPKSWWQEKMIDDLNYNILLQGLLKETYFEKINFVSFPE